MRTAGLLLGSGAATICAPAMAAPVRSVTRPKRTALDCGCDCARAAVKNEKLKNSTARKLKGSNCRRQSFIFIPRLPLARECEGCPGSKVRGAVRRSGFATRDGNSVGLLARRDTSGAAFPSRCRVFRRSTRRSDTRPTFSALQSRSGGGFSPPSRARSFVVIWPVESPRWTSEEIPGVSRYLKRLGGFFGSGLWRNARSC